MRKSIFEADKIRQALAKERKTEELIATYDGSLLDIPSMNNSKKWDFRAVDASRMVTGIVNADTSKRLELVSRCIDSSKKILDFGVGPGDILPLLIKKNKNLDYTGIDISNNFIERLKKMFPRQKFECKDLSSVANESYDEILALEVFEHIEIASLKKVYMHLWRILTIKGNLIISVPINEKLEDFTIYCSKCGSLENIAGHVRSFTPELIMAELQLAGFKIVSYKLMWPASKNYLKNFIKITLRNITKKLPVTIVIKAEKIALGKNVFPDYKNK